MQHLPEYRTVKFEHQERIEKAAHYRAARVMTRDSKEAQAGRRPVGWADRSLEVRFNVTQRVLRRMRLLRLVTR